MKPLWTRLSQDAKRDLVTAGFSEGKTARQVAAQCQGATKNAVIGFAFRNDIKRPAPVKGGRPQGSRNKRNIVMPDETAPEGGVLFLDRKPSQCAWFLPETEHLAVQERKVCGGRCGGSNFSYCPHHLQIVAPVVALAARARAA